MASITLENLRKEFGDVVAVENTNLKIPDGSFAALLGPSGCGKTTTLNMISGFEMPTSGNIYFDSDYMNNVLPGDRDIGFVFQNYAIFTHMTVFKNLAFGLTVKKRPKTEILEEVKQIAELLQLNDQLFSKAGRLSINDMQKVALGRSMIIQPSIFLLDEPFSNLDSSFRAYMRGELKRIQRESGQTMIYVTHDQVEAMSMADYIAVMDVGVLQQFATPDEIYNQPANAFVAGFIGSPNMNLIDCTFEIVDGQARLVAEDGSAQVELDSKRRHLIEEAGGRKFKIGIRPEHLVASSEPAENGTWEAVVRFVELLGPKTIIHLEMGQNVIRTIASSDYRPDLDQKQWLTPNQDYLHIFETESGEAIR